MQIKLDGKKMKNIEKTHDYLKKEFKLADYYGRNLDALWDMLSEKDEKLEIELYNEEEMYKNLGSFSEKLLSLFEDLTIENENIMFNIILNQ